MIKQLETAYLQTDDDLPEELYYPVIIAKPNGVQLHVDGVDDQELVDGGFTAEKQIVKYVREDVYRKRIMASLKGLQAAQQRAMRRVMSLEQMQVDKLVEELRGFLLKEGYVVMKPAAVDPYALHKATRKNQGHDE